MPPEEFIMARYGNGGNTEKLSEASFKGLILEKRSAASPYFVVTKLIISTK